jgi:hypothetical protein
MIAHARLSASGSERWMNCPGSPRLSEGLPEIETEYAAEGTAAHIVALWCRQQKKRAEDFLDSTVDVLLADGKSMTIHVGEEMVESVQSFLDEVDRQREEGAYVLFEHGFNLAALNPPEEMFGTADAVVYAPSIRTLYVDDLKYGQGIVVEAEDNSQGQMYALGALLEFEKLHPAQQIDKIVIAIVQPRAYHPEGSIRRWSISYEDLLAFASVLLERAHATQGTATPLVVGPWCRFCRAAGICPARLKAAESVAMVEFQNVPVDRPPEPEALPATVVGDLLTKLPLLEGWVRSLRAHAEAALNRGEAIPGWKLVPKRATRRWRDERAVLDFIDRHGIPPAAIHETVMKSVAQAEKALRKWKLEIPEDLFSKESSGPTLAPEDDPRPAALVGPAQDFVEPPKD